MRIGLTSLDLFLHDMSTVAVKLPGRSLDFSPVLALHGAPRAGQGSVSTLPLMVQLVLF